MSRSAVFLLIMTLLSLGSLWLNPDMAEIPALALKCASGFFGFAFAFALVAGRRFKFDPILR
ncbi:PA3371 family protein [Pseudomonas subflava]|uniref:PA3371 family protein n=1 Tax=Pseudomonas subflava TaxID=2952933 RepID=UPI00207A4F61|nr:PA3371 family protein [Pseudomonas subflava]